jgi:hypothetical protein
MLISMSDSLVSIGSDRKIHTLARRFFVPWGGFIPTPHILLRRQATLYRMRQFVGEFDLTTKKFRFPYHQLRSFLTKRAKEDEERIRKQYGG